MTVYDECGSSGCGSDSGAVVSWAPAAAAAAAARWRAVELGERRRNDSGLVREGWRGEPFWFCDCWSTSGRSERICASTSTIALDCHSHACRAFSSTDLVQLLQTGECKGVSERKKRDRQTHSGTGPLNHLSRLISVIVRRSDGANRNSFCKTLFNHKS